MPLFILPNKHFFYSKIWVIWLISHLWVFLSSCQKTGCQFFLSILLSVSVTLFLHQCVETLFCVLLIQLKFRPPTAYLTQGIGGLSLTPASRTEVTERSSFQVLFKEFVLIFSSRFDNHQKTLTISIPFLSFSEHWFKQVL